MALTQLFAPQTPKTLGSFYTPLSLANWLAAEVLRHAPRRTPLKALDPACGDGALLLALQRLGHTNLQITGVDLNQDALQNARESLGAGARLVQANALTVDLAEACGGQPDMIIANPPWGGELFADGEVVRDRFDLARGQFDTFELFLELAVRTLAPGGVLGFVIPDSIFLPEHSPARRLITERLSLLEVVRLGEGVFDGVFRGAVLLVAKKRPPTSSSQLSYARLTREGRHLLRSPSARLHDLLTFHKISQGRLQSTADCGWDLEASDEDETFHRIDACGTLCWDDHLFSGRGIEIGKRGTVTICGTCGAATPRPKASDTRCASCTGSLADGTSSSIIDLATSSSRQGWAPLIVGEDVSRYSACPSRSVAMDVPGIRYKNANPGRQLLVRKTGVGIQAAIDESGAQTTQTVFVFTLRAGAPAFMLDYVLGVLNSRVLQAFHLRRSGDSEWRSHPYVTPKVLKTLPIPDPCADASTERLAMSVAKLACGMTDRPDRDKDRQLDELVNELYGLGSGGTTWAANVLSSAQQLMPIRRLLE